jgi:hypothetical protein
MIWKNLIDRIDIDHQNSNRKFHLKNEKNMHDVLFNQECPEHRNYPQIFGNFWSILDINFLNIIEKKNNQPLFEFLWLRNTLVFNSKTSAFRLHQFEYVTCWKNSFFPSSSSYLFFRYSESRIIFLYINYTSFIRLVFQLFKLHSILRS